LDHNVQDDLNIDVGGEDTSGGQESNRLRFVHSLGIAVQSLYCADVTESLAYIALVRRVAAFYRTTPLAACSRICRRRSTAYGYRLLQTQIRDRDHGDRVAVSKLPAEGNGTRRLMIIHRPAAAALNNLYAPWV
jgi:hypothetical protein